MGICCNPEIYNSLQTMTSELNKKSSVVLKINKKNKEKEENIFHREKKSRKKYKVMNLKEN